MLTFVHTNELRVAKWAEYDFYRTGWRVPAERIKRAPSTLRRYPDKPLPQYQQQCDDGFYPLVKSVKNLDSG